MMVASIICSAASDTPLPASPSRITSQTPLSAHRRNCLKIEFQLPKPSGRSRHGAPVRSQLKHRVEHAAMIAWRPAAAAMDQERFEVRPLIVGHQSANQGCPPQKVDSGSICDFLRQ